MERPIIINLFAGPGCGKSTTSAGVFCLLKLHDIEIEYVDEFCKGLVWEERDFTFKNQLYLFTKQQHRIWRAADKVDVVVTDSPVLLSCVYRKDLSSDAFKQVVLETHNTHTNMNFLLTREKKYHTVGRNQTKEEAISLDNQIKEMLETYKVPYHIITGTYEAPNKIAAMVLDKFGKELIFKLQKG